MKMETEKFLKLLVVFAFGANPVNSQILDPFCENIAGGNSINGVYSFDWSMGETPCVQTMQIGRRYLYSSGFLQSRNEAESTFNQVDSFKLKISISPNPTANNIFIRCNQDGMIIDAIKIIDAFGNTIKDINEPAAGIYYTKQIPLTTLLGGVYLVIVKFRIAETIVGYKMVKIIKL